MQTAEHLDAHATASERDRTVEQSLDAPVVLDADVEAWLESLKSGAVAVATPTPDAARSQAASGPTENASDLPASRESCKPSAGACASGGAGSLSASFLVAAGALLAAEFSLTGHALARSSRQPCIL